MSRENAIKSLKNIPCQGYMFFLYSMESSKKSQSTRRYIQDILESQTMYTRFKGFHVVPLFDDEQYGALKDRLEAIEATGWIERTYIRFSKEDFEEIDFTER